MKRNIELHQKELGKGGIQIVEMSSAELSLVQFPPHRDDHLALIIQTEGVFALELDFRSVQIEGAGFCYILPGQVHYYKKMIDCRGWFVFLDNKYINAEFQEILNTFSTGNPCIPLNRDTSIVKLVELIELQLSVEEKTLEAAIVFSLAEALIAMIAAEVLYSKVPPDMAGSRRQALVTDFKKLVRTNFKEVKQVKAYAAMLFISPLYLNESVKALTGFNASYWIHQEIILEAKRLLRFTKLDINEIADDLGFEDPVYFSRFFKKHAAETASDFRNNKP